MENEAWNDAWNWVEKAVGGESTSAHCPSLLVAMIFNQKLYVKKMSVCIFKDLQNFNRYIVAPITLSRRCTTVYKTPVAISC